jgi:hypothetical protein
MTQDRFNDALDSEILDAQEQQLARDEAAELGFEIPEKFKGKEITDIVKSYTELEKAYSRQGKSLGEMRQTFDEYIRSQSANPAPKEEPRKPLTVDELYENPDEAIRRTVDSTTSPRLKQIEEQLSRAKLETQLEKFEKRHPDWKKEAASPEFQNWVTSSPYRMRLAAAADKYDLDAAEDLFSAYADTRRTDTNEEKEERSAKLKNATLETSSPSTPRRTKTFSRREVMDKKTRAAKGDWQAGEWLRENSASIDAAYAEGRIVD